MTDSGLTRGDFVRRSAAAGIAIGGALGPRWLGDAFAAVEPAKVHTYVSRPDFRLPILSIVRRSEEASDGHLFMAPNSGPGQRGPLILDEAGQPVWFRNARPVVAMNFRPGIYKGKPVLSWWEGKTTAGLGDGTHIIVDDTYREIARVPAGGGRPSDLHEFILTDRGTALVTSWERVFTNLSGIGGQSRGVVVNAIVQEIELPSGRVLFEWKSLDHVPITESHAGPSSRAAYDYFHVNSVELDRDGNYLVSARNTWCVYKIDRGTGEIMWRLGGKQSDFTFGTDATFAWQHDARRHGGSDYLVSVFDDGSVPGIPSQPYSKGLVLDLDFRRKHASVYRKYIHAPRLLAHSLGSLQMLPNGNVLVGWGSSPFVTEYTRDGHVVFDAHLPHGGENYRALRQPWVGKPVTPPDAVYKRTEGHPTVYVSWNGATEVASWLLHHGPTQSTIAAGSKTPRHSFETAVPVPTGSKYAYLSALDRHGKELGRSKVIRV
jgi:arylsulfotransferase ASST